MSKYLIILTFTEEEEKYKGRPNYDPKYKIEHQVTNTVGTIMKYKTIENAQKGALNEVYRYLYNHVYPRGMTQTEWIEEIREFTIRDDNKDTVIGLIKQAVENIQVIVWKEWKAAQINKPDKNWIHQHEVFWLSLHI